MFALNIVPTNTLLLGTIIFYRCYFLAQIKYAIPHIHYFFAIDCPFNSGEAHLAFQVSGRPCGCSLGCARVTLGSRINAGRKSYPLGRA